MFRIPRTLIVVALLSTGACNDAPTRPTPNALPAVSGPSLGANVGGNNRRILFASDRDAPGNFEIYSMNPDGSGIARLTNSAGPDVAPAWSPDGKRIAFVSLRHDSFGEIYVMNADGTGVRRVTESDGIDTSPTWSKDGKRIAFVSMRNDPFGDIYTVNDDGSDVSRVTDYAGADAEPSWSADGKQIAFVSDRDGLSDLTTDLYVVTLDTRQVSRLTNEALDVDVHEPSWAPGGKQIAYSTSYDSGDDIILTSDVFVINVDDRLITRLTDGPGTAVQDLAPSWSPDGKQIAYVSIRGGNSEIFIMNADGNSVSRLTTSTANDVSPAWNR